MNRKKMIEIRVDYLMDINKNKILSAFFLLLGIFLAILGILFKEYIMIIISYVSFFFGTLSYIQFQNQLTRILILELILGDEDE